MENKLIQKFRASVIRAIYFYRDENHIKLNVLRQNCIVRVYQMYMHYIFLSSSYT